MIYAMSPRHVSFLKKQELCFISEEILQPLICVYTAFFAIVNVNGTKSLHIYKISKGKNLQFNVGENYNFSTKGYVSTQCLLTISKSIYNY